MELDLKSLDTASMKSSVATHDNESLECVDCGAEFVYGEEERRFYLERGFKEPIRCLDCREKRRAERNADLIRSHEAQTSSSSWVEALGHYGGGLGGQRNDTSRKPPTTRPSALPVAKTPPCRSFPEQAGR